MACTTPPPYSSTAFPQRPHALRSAETWAGAGDALISFLGGTGGGPPEPLPARATGGEKSLASVCGLVAFRCVSMSAIIKFSSESSSVVDDARPPPPSPAVAAFVVDTVARGEKLGRGARPGPALGVGRGGTGGLLPMGGAAGVVV
jgi:hypothetical protein